MINESLIKLATDKAVEQKKAAEAVRQKHIDDIYNEAMFLLEKSIKEGKIYSGYVRVRTKTSYLPCSGLEEQGYCGWKQNIFVWAHEGCEVAEKIRKQGIKCDYVDSPYGDPFFRFNFNK